MMDDLINVLGIGGFGFCIGFAFCLKIMGDIKNDLASVVIYLRKMVD